LKNIQTALQCSEVLQAGLANIFQGPMMDALKVAVKAPVRVGLSLFGTAIDIVSSVIQDDPSRVPQLIETNVLPEVMGALSKETMRSTECLSFVPGILASIALHAVMRPTVRNVKTQATGSSPVLHLSAMAFCLLYSDWICRSRELAPVFAMKLFILCARLEWWFRWGKTSSWDLRQGCRFQSVLLWDGLFMSKSSAKAN
ncbi:TOM1, partial [Symbiodinium pilosum]